MRTIYVDRNQERAEWLVRFDFDRQLSDALRDLPKWSRRWDPDRRAWVLLSAGVVKDFVQKANALGWRVLVERPQEKPPAATRKPDKRTAALAEMFLTPDAPAAIVKEVHRLLVKHFHPDRGGDLAKMQRINAAYDVVKAGR